MGQYGINDADLFGIEHLDEQHRRLHDMLDALDAAVAEGRGRQELFNLLDAFITETDAHMAAEEDLMRAHGYPGAGEHEDDHREMGRRLKTFKEDVSRVRLNVTVDAVRWIGGMALSHLRDKDKAYAAFFSSRGTH